MIADDRDSPAYWDERARPFLGGADEWRAVTVEGPATVAAQNQRLEKRGATVLERYLPRGSRVLDAGCGNGRWFSLTAPGRSLTGMDFSSSLVDRAQANPWGVDVMLGDVRDIPAAPSTFDSTYTVKVLQCLTEQDRVRAVAELFRVTAPGGVIVLFEKTRGPDGSRPRDWIHWAELAGGNLVAWHPNAYVLPDRAIRCVANLGRRLKRPGRRTSNTHPAYARVRALALALCIPLEPLAERMLPRGWAEHGIFVFQK